MLGTSCRFCEFKISDENNVQTGCELDLIRRYGVEPKLTAFDDEHGKGEAFEIDTFCIYRRPSGWKAAKKDLLVDGKTYADIAREEISLNVTLVVHVGPGKTYQDVMDFTKYTNNMTKKPNKILFINFAKISPLLFRNLNGETQTNLEWGMEYMLIDDCKPDALRMKGIDLASKKVKTNFFVTLGVEERLPLNYLETIEKAIADDLQKFVAIIDDLEKPNFYQTVVFRHVRGYEQAPANDKIKWIAEEQECLNLVKTPQEIFQVQK